MNFKKRVNGSWVDIPCYTYKTSTEAIENPLYSDGTAITNYTIKGNTVQNGTPTPSNPVDVNGVGERTGNLWDGAIGLDNTQILKNDGTVVANPNYALSDYIPVSASTSYVYSFRHNQYESNRTSFTVSFYKSNKQLVQTIVLQRINDEGIITIPFTTPANTAYIRINWKKPYDDMLMLSLGSTAKPYEPYGYKIPISSGGVTTNIYLGSTQTTRRIKKLVLTGEEDWQVSSSWKKTNTSVFFYYQADIVNAGSTSKIYVISDKFEATSRDGLYNGDTDMIARTGGNAMTIRVSDSIATTAQAFKTWLSENPVTVWYVLQTATTSTVNEPLQKIGDYADTLSNAVSIPTTEGANSITVDTTVQPSEFTATWTGWHPVQSVHKYDSNYTIATMQTLTVAQLQTHTISELQGGEWS